MSNSVKKRKIRAITAFKVIEVGTNRKPVCDRRTDEQMDGRTDRILITIPRLHYMQRGNNHFSAGASLWTPLGEITMLLQTT